MQFICNEIYGQLTSGHFHDPLQLLLDLLWRQNLAIPRYNLCLVELALPTRGQRTNLVCNWFTKH